MSEDSNTIRVKVNIPLIAEIKNLLNLDKKVPAKYAVDTALKTLKDILQGKMEGEGKRKN